MFVAVPTVAVHRRGVRRHHRCPRRARRRRGASSARRDIPVWLDRLAQWSWRLLVGGGLRAALRRRSPAQVPAVIGPIVVAITLAATFLPAVRVLEARRGWIADAGVARHQRRAVGRRSRSSPSCPSRPSSGRRPTRSRAPSRPRRPARRAPTDRCRPACPGAVSSLSSAVGSGSCRRSPRSSPASRSSSSSWSCPRCWRSSSCATASKAWAVDDRRGSAAGASARSGPPATQAVVDARRLHDRDRRRSARSTRSPAS